MDTYVQWDSTAQSAHTIGCNIICVWKLYITQIMYNVYFIFLGYLSDVHDDVTWNDAMIGHKMSQVLYMFHVKYKPVPFCSYYHVVKWSCDHMIYMITNDMCDVWLQKNAAVAYDGRDHGSFIPDPNWFRSRGVDPTFLIMYEHKGEVNPFTFCQKCMGTRRGNPSKWGMYECQMLEMYYW